MKNQFEIHNGTARIRILFKGQTHIAMIDTEDLPKINQWSWCFGTHGYAVNGHSQGMHQFVIDCPRGLVIDHVNHNRLDNRRANLRVLTRAQNLLHRPDTRNAYFIRQRGRWRAQIGLGRKTIYLGYFDTEEEAAAVGMNARRLAIQGLPVK